MKTEWSFPFAEGKLWEPNCEGQFFDGESGLLFFYENNKKLSATRVLTNGIEHIHIEAYSVLQTIADHKLHHSIFGK